MVMDDDDFAEYFWALHKLNQALLEGLIGASSFMKNWDNVPDVKKQAAISMIDGLIAQGEDALGKLDGKY